MSEHHHKETFVTKYIFSHDHKMISKQFLITGMIMGVIGIFMSMLFRLQLAWPEKSFTIIEAFLGPHQTDGIMSPDIYLASSYHTRNHYGILCANSRFKWYLFKFTNPIADWST